MQVRDPESFSPNPVPEAEGASAAAPHAAGSAPACAIIALSDDPLLLEALSGAARADSPLISAPSTDRFIDQLVAHGAGIALIDASSVSAPLKAFLVTLREQFPQLLLLLAGPAHLQAQFTAQLAEGTIFRFVHKPASSQRLKLFIDAALRQHAAPELPSARTLAEAGARRALAAESPTGGRRGLTLVALSGAALAAGGIVWAVWHQQPDQSTPSTSTQIGGDAPAATHAVAPEGEQQPAADAQAARDLTSSEAAARDQSAGEQAAREAAALEQAQRLVQGARADQVAVYMQLARRRLASGALIEPADDSARSYLAAAQKLAPEDPDVRASALALGEALVAQFRRAVEAGDGAAAQRWLQACSDYRIPSTTLNELSMQLQRLANGERSGASATVSASASAPAPLGTPPAPATAPSGTASVAASSNTPSAMPEALAPTAAPAAATTADYAAPAAPAAPVGLVNEGTLRRVLFVPPVYPNYALEHDISGWVDLEFTVTEEGKVANIVVLAAQPDGIFERAARDAMASCRYRPLVRDGVPVAQRTRIRIRFER
jgi:TonB family protein